MSEKLRIAMFGQKRLSRECLLNKPYWCSNVKKSLFCTLYGALKLVIFHSYMNCKCQIFIQNAELLTYVAQKWHKFFRCFEEMPVWVISTYFKRRSSMHCSSLTAESVNLIERYVQFQQSSCTGSLWFNNTTLRKNVIAGYTGFDCIKQHFGYSGVETGVLNRVVWSKK